MMRIKQGIYCPNLTIVIHRIVNGAFSTYTYSFSIIEILIDISHNSTSSIYRHSASVEVLIVTSIPD